MAAAIQPIGFHLRLSSDWCIDAVSANIGAFLRVSTDAIAGQPVTNIFSETAVHDIRNRMALLRGDEAVEHLLRLVLVDGGEPFDLTVYRSGEGYGLDAEPCRERGFGDATGIIEGMLARVDEGDDTARLCEQAARQVRGLTGFDHVSIWLDGEVAGRSARPTKVVPSPLPPIGHDLMIADLGAAPAAMCGGEPDRAPARSSALSAPSGSQRDWLGSTGAEAALVLPLADGGAPWGNICCLHQGPHHLSVERRNILRLFARILGLRIEVARLRAVT